MSEIPAGRVVARLRWIGIVLASLCLAAIVVAVRLDGPPADLLFNCGIAIVAFGIPSALAAIVAHRTNPGPMPQVWKRVRRIVRNRKFGKQRVSLASVANIGVLPAACANSVSRATVLHTSSDDTFVQGVVEHLAKALGGDRLNQRQCAGG